MNAPRLSNHLRLLFILAVLAPCAVLAFLSVRSIDREEAFLEKRLQGALDAEVSHAVSLIREDLGRIQDELTAGAPRDVGDDPRAALAAWKKAAPLVGVPFLLAADFRILWPTRDAYFAQDDLAFLNWNRDFVTDAKPTPIYQNVALLYKDQIAAPEQMENATGGGAIQNKKEAGAPSAAKSAAPINLRVAAPAAAPETGGGGKAGKSENQDIRLEQQALADFAQSDVVRKRVYDEAARQGQKAESRTVSPQAGLPQKSDASESRAESIYISEPRKFSQITAGKASGLIPRFIDDKLSLLFWKRLASGRIVGCVVEDAAARARILGRLPDVVSQGRILTVLDENGRPLVAPAGQDSRDWRRPLVAREVSETLPRWEVAAYPADPGAMASQARSTRLMMAVLILALFGVIAAAGTWILHTLRSEMILARQKTTFVTNVSHELKTPLTSIRMFSEMLKEGRQPDPIKQRAYLGLMAAETGRLTRLINNVLDFSKMEKGKRAYARRRLDAGVLAEGIVEGERIRLEHDGFAVSFASASGPAPVEADEEALCQAVLNLLSNAEKYSAGVKSVEVEIGREDGTVRIDVKDRGIGIPAAEAGKIFREFYRVDRTLAAPVSGSGLGLTIARRIARDHGGDVEYRPRDGGGSVFRITLPEAEARP
jgi:signal transduction histidine kinase